MKVNMEEMKYGCKGGRREEKMDGRKRPYRRGGQR